MVNEIVMGLAGSIILGVLVVAIVQTISFIFDVPKQLKRIADALENEKEDGK